MVLRDAGERSRGGVSLWGTICCHAMPLGLMMVLLFPFPLFCVSLRSLLTVSRSC